jgi:hypothetical protein
MHARVYVTQDGQPPAEAQPSKTGAGLEPPRFCKSLSDLSEEMQTVCLGWLLVGMYSVKTEMHIVKSNRNYTGQRNRGLQVKQSHWHCST